MQWKNQVLQGIGDVTGCKLFWERGFQLVQKIYKLLSVSTEKL